MKKIRFLLMLPAILLAGQSQAFIILTEGAGNSVASADRSATFDNLTSNGIDLSAYNEDSLNVTVPDTSYQNFDAFNTGKLTAFHYGVGGNDSWVTINATDGSRIYGLEFLLGHGQSPSHANVVWELRRNGSTTGSGTFETTRGVIRGWCDTEGFDELRVGARGSDYNSFGQDQSIALDDLDVQLSPNNSCNGEVVRPITEIPVPTLGQWSIILMMLAIGGTVFLRRRHLADLQ
jgi:hypothetical protein